jgi:hypothetical protein
MRNIKKNLTYLSLFFALGLVGPVTIFAATTPVLGTAGSFGILSSTFTRNIGVTTITGNAGYTTLSGGGTDSVSGITYVPAPAQAGVDQGTALSDLNGQACTFTFAAGAVDLASDITHGTVGVYTPGVYCTLGAASIGTAGINLSGSGTYIFRIGGALTTVDNSPVTLSGASACDVFWTPTSATTLGANTSFIGTVIDDAGITVGNSTSWSGRALAFAETITMDTNTISVPSSCTGTTLIDDVATSTATSTPEVVSHSSGSSGGTHFGCKDPTASNYDYFSSSKPSLCVYDNIVISEVATTTTIVNTIVIATTTTTTIVSLPNFPSTGFPPKEQSTSWLSYILCQLKIFQNKLF